MFWRVFFGFMIFGLCAGEVYAEDGGCPTPLPYNTTCKNGKIYCADAEVSGKNIEGYGCINKRWVCTSYVCLCGDMYIGRFGQCDDGKPMCGTTQAPIPWIVTDNDSKDIQYGFICQNNNWVCANPRGCSTPKQTCHQFQVYKDGQCQGKDGREKISAQKCKTGNCPCGSGHCPMHGICLDGECVCGGDNIDETVESSSVSVGGDYGEFVCVENYSTPPCGPGTRIYGLYCMKAGGCKRADGKLFPTTPLDVHEHVIYNLEDVRQQVLRGEPVIDRMTTQGAISAPCSPEKFKSVTEKLSEISLSPCGRRSAEEMPRNIPDEPENYDDTKIYDFRCDIRSKCDTMPIPKSARKDYRCVVHKHRVMQCDEPAHGFDVLGLRCTNPKGCPCFDDTCKKGQFCTEGLCK